MKILVVGALLMLFILTTVDLGLADAEGTERFACGGFHVGRSNNLGGSELGWTSFNVRNFNADESVTIQGLIGASGAAIQGEELARAARSCTPVK